MTDVAALRKLISEIPEDPGSISWDDIDAMRNALPGLLEICERIADIADNVLGMQEIAPPIELLDRIEARASKDQLRIVELESRWLELAQGDHCGLCGNRGELDIATHTPAGYPAHSKGYCICPNGEAWRQALTRSTGDE